MGIICLKSESFLYCFGLVLDQDIIRCFPFWNRGSFFHFFFFFAALRREKSEAGENPVGKKKRKKAIWCRSHSLHIPMMFHVFVIF